MGVEKKTISTKLDDKTIAALKEILEKENRSMSNLIETIVKEYLSNRAK